MSRVRASLAAVLAVVALVLSACGNAPDASVPPGPATQSVTVVTVPELDSTGTAPAGTGTGRGGVISVVPRASEAAADGVTSETNAPTSLAGAAESDIAAGATMPDAPTVSPTAAIPPREPANPAPVVSTAQAAGSTTVAVDLASCAGCTVIGVAADVRPGLAASLATAPHGAVLLATRADGAVVGVINVPYGVTFRAPTGAVLPCDRSGRCFVAAAQPRGNGVISVFHLAADGQWSDVTASGGFASTTATALVRDVDGDGLLDIAVQAQAADALRWVVYHWVGDRFAVLGCAAGSQPLPDDAEVSLAACS